MLDYLNVDLDNEEKLKEALDYKIRFLCKNVCKQSRKKHKKKQKKNKTNHTSFPMRKAVHFEYSRM